MSGIVISCTLTSEITQATLISEDLEIILSALKLDFLKLVLEEQVWNI